MQSKTDREPMSQDFSTSPSEPPVGSTRTDLPRWAELGLADPRRDGRLPEDGSTADVLAYASVLPGAADPVEGGAAQVAAELGAAETLLGAWRRRLEAFLHLGRRADGRASGPSPAEDESPSITTP